MARFTLFITLLAVPLFASDCYTILVSSQWKSARFNSKLDVQTREAAKFLQDLNKAAEGQPDRLLTRKIEILPRRFMGRSASIILRDNVLLLTPQNFFGWISPLSADHIRNLWDDGKQFPKKSLERKIWPYINPTGFFQKTLRTTIAAQAKEFSSFLRALINKEDFNATTTLEKISNYLTNILDANSEQVSPVISNLASKNDEQLKRALKFWLRHIQNANNISITATSESTAEEKPFNQNILGLITVGNYHRIRVSVYGGDSPQEAIALRVPYQNLKASIWAVGIIAIHTVDDVEVRVDYNALRFILSAFRHII
jgi:hypothetical protein